MVEEGHLDDVDAVYGFHVWPTLPSGYVATSKQYIMAGSLQFSIKIIGKGGHAAMPHLTNDPIVATASVVQTLQTLVSRETSPIQSAVVSVTRIHGGEAYNVIPDEVEIGGTIRSFDDRHVDLIKLRMMEMLTGISMSHGVSFSLDFMEDAHPYYPATVNDPDRATFAMDVAGELFGPHKVQDVTQEPSMAGEDFGFMTKKAPGAFVWLGIRNETAGSTYGLHTAKFTLDEQVLHRGAALHAALVLKHLDRVDSPDDPRNEL